MRILITGAQGTLGRVLLGELRRRGHDVWGCDLKHSDDPQQIRADISESRQLHRVFLDARPQLVYHLAAEFGRMNGQEFYEQLWRTNCIGTRNVIEECLLFRAKLAFASSSEAYGDADRYAPDGRQFAEDFLDEFAPGFHNEYALTKWANERQIFMAAKNEHLDAVVFRFFNAYGPGEHYTPYRSVVCLFIYRLMHGLPITVYKNYRRVFMWVGDWARTVANLADAGTYEFIKNTKDWPGSLGTNVPVFNIGGTEFLSVEELKDKILELLGGSASQITYWDAEKANVISKRPDVQLAKAFLNHDPSTTLAVGLPKTIDWMKQVYAKPTTFEFDEVLPGRCAR